MDHISNCWIPFWRVTRSPDPFSRGFDNEIESNLAEIPTERYALLTLPARKWHWRARTSALQFSQIIPKEHRYKVLLTSSVLNLAELIGIRPDLAKCRKIVYFHENQLVYPVQEIKQRDCQYGLNEIMTW